MNQSVEVDDVCESLNDGGLREDSEERLCEATSIRDVIPILRQEERVRGQAFIGRVLHELIGRVPQLQDGLLSFLPELMEGKATTLACKFKDYVRTQTHTCSCYTNRR